MTRSELVDYSGIQDRPEFRAVDYALPMRKDGTYPNKGLAVSVYWERRVFPEIIPLSELAQAALSDQGKVNEMIEDDEEKGSVIEQLKEMASWEVVE